MDNKLIQQHGEDILCYRIRTARHKKRMQYKSFEKQMLQLYREEKTLSWQKWKLGWEPLIPPVQKGWKRFFVLRDDVAASRDAAFFEGILAKINTFDWSYRKNFLVKKKRMGRNTYRVKGQQLLRPYERDFHKFEFTEKEKLFFDEVWDTTRSKQPVKRFVFNQPWRFVLKVRPNMIGKIRIIDSALEARLEEIDNYLGRNNMRGKQARLVRGRYQDNWCNTEREKERNPLKNKPVNKILDEMSH
jgi:hypothetical protein